MKRNMIPIWGETIPGNNGKKKEIRPVCRIGFPYYLLRWMKAITNAEYHDIRKISNDFTYVAGIAPGFESRYYDDVPYLEPFLVDSSDIGVIVVPGGGFTYKSRDIALMDTEAVPVARQLNKSGINAFILHYRSNPYKLPVSLLDAQRAVRFLRCHAKEYHLDPNKIGMVGFSAGGMETVGVLSILRDQPVCVDGYTPDKNDEASARLNFAGLIYGVVNFRGNVPLLSVCFAENETRNAAQIEDLLDKYDGGLAAKAGDPPQFICYGDADTCVPPAVQEAYIAKLEEKHIPHEVVVLDGAGHGFGACTLINRKQAFWMDDFARWITKICKGK